MTNILFYGNCQVGAVKHMLDKIIEDYHIEMILCYATDISKDNFIKSIKNADIIITQPININYRNTDYLDTEFLLKHCNMDTKIIIFPSIFFDLYYFDMTYLHLNNNSLLKEPSDYHYNKMIEVYKYNNSGEDDYIEKYVDNIEYKSKYELEKIADDSIQELIKREKKMLDYLNIHDCHLISVSDYIQKNYKKKLLFYSMNHPTKWLFHYVCENIVDYLLKFYQIQGSINYVRDPLFQSERGILYKSLKNILEFDFDSLKPRLSTCNLEDNKTIVNKYFEIYRHKDLHNLLKK